MRIILASQSPRRLRALNKLGIKFDVIASNFPEESVKEKNPLKLVEKLALEKARVVAKKYPNSLVIGADTLIKLGEKILGKPKDVHDARRVLRKASGKTLNDFNGLAVVYKGKEKSIGLIGTAVMRRYTNAEIEDYFSRINPLDKAGGFAADSAEGGEFLQKYHGEPGQELGLPLSSLSKFLKEFGVKT